MSPTRGFNKAVEGLGVSRAIAIFLKANALPDGVLESLDAGALLAVHFTVLEEATKRKVLLEFSKRTISLKELISITSQNMREGVKEAVVAKFRDVPLTDYEDLEQFAGECPDKSLIPIRVAELLAEKVSWLTSDGIWGLACRMPSGSSPWRSLLELAIKTLAKIPPQNLVAAVCRLPDSEALVRLLAEKAKTADGDFSERLEWVRAVAANPCLHSYQQEALDSLVGSAKFPFDWLTVWINTTGATHETAAQNLRQLPAPPQDDMFLYEFAVEAKDQAMADFAASRVVQASGSFTDWKSVFYCITRNSSLLSHFRQLALAKMGATAKTGPEWTDLYFLTREINPALAERAFQAAIDAYVPG